MEVTDIETGEIFHLLCDQTKPPKNKFHLFLNDGYYLLINSKNLIPGLPIKKADYPFLDHDSFIGSRLFRYQINKIIDHKGKRTKINHDTANQLKGFIANEKGLSQQSKTIILEALNEI
jgi:hypothetical protein